MIRRGPFSPHFAAFFALRPQRIECPFFSLDDEEFFVVEGLGWLGRRSQTPRCSATPIRCMRGGISTKTFVIHLVRTTTKHVGSNGCTAVATEAHVCSGCHGSLWRTRLGSRQEAATAPFAPVASPRALGGAEGPRNCSASQRAAGRSATATEEGEGKRGGGAGPARSVTTTDGSSTGKAAGAS